MIRRLIIRSFLAAVTVSSPLTAQDNGEIEREMAEAIQESVREMEREIQRQEIFDRQLDICRAALDTRDWVAYVEAAVATDPTLGPMENHIRICMAYVTGRLDHLRAERQRLQRR